MDTFVLEDLFDAQTFEYSGNSDSLIFEGGPATNDWSVERSGSSVVVSAATGLGVGSVTVLAPLPDEIVLNTLGGNDVVTVDNTAGLVNTQVVYNGGVGTDSLELTGSTVLTSSVYTPGPAADAGTVIHTAGAVTQTVRFTGLEPVVDLVAGPLTVNGTNGNNAINYSQGSVATNGLVSVDGFETIEFSNKTSLTFNGQSGSDAINLNHPGTPTGLTSVSVDGGDPSGTDSLTIHGTAGAITVDVTAGTFTGATGLATAAYADIDQLHVVAGISGGLVVNGSSAVSPVNYVFTPGAAPDQGSIQTIGVPITFDDFGAGDNIVLNADAAGPSDSVVLNGTSGGDAFDATSVFGIVIWSSSGQARPFIDSNNVENLTINGMESDDVFDVNGSHPYAQLTIDGGGGSAAGDRLDFTGSGGPLTLDPALRQITEVTSVNYNGIEHVDTWVADSSLTVLGTLNNDLVTVTPNGVGSGSFVPSTLPAVHYTYAKAGLGLVIDGGGGGTFDVMRILGHNGPNNVTSGPSSITLDTGLIVAGAGMERLQLETLGGNDTINLASFTALSTEIDSGGGHDSITGSPQADVINASAGNDSIVSLGGIDDIEGGGGNDTATGGTGADLFSGGGGGDTFIWNPGDGSDLVEGEGGADTLIFNGSNGDEIFTLNAAGSRFELLRNVGAIDMDVAGVEQVQVNALDGADQFTVNDLFGTGVKGVRLDTGVGDGDDDSVTVNGSSRAERIQIRPGAGGAVELTGLKHTLLLAGGPSDALTVNGNGGNDNIRVFNGVQAVFSEITLDGGTGRDNLRGGPGLVTLIGGPGADTLTGDADDTFVSDANDTIVNI